MVLSILYVPIRVKIIDEEDLLKLMVVVAMMLLLLSLTAAERRQRAENVFSFAPISLVSFEFLLAVLFAQSGAAEVNPAPNLVTPAH